MANDLEQANKMDTDDVKEIKGRMFVTFLNQQNVADKKGSLRVVSRPDINFSTLTLGDFKDLIVQDDQCPIKSSDEIDVVHNAEVITNQVTSTLQHLKIKPNSVVSVVKRFTKKPIAPGNENQIEEVSAAADSDISAGARGIDDQHLHQVSMALRTGFIHPSFPKTIKKLGEPEMLENIIAIAPQLATDTLGLAIIQTPAMIYYYTEGEAMKKLANERPWVIDAFNFIAAAIHQDKSSANPQLPRGLVVSELLNREEVDDDDMDDDDELSSGNNTPRRAASMSNASRGTTRQTVFTRDQIEQALRSALPAYQGLDPPPPGASIQGSAFAPVNRSSSWTSPSDTRSPISSNTFQNALANSQPRQPRAPRNPEGGINSNAVARAIMDAVSYLPPEERNAQLNALRDRILAMASATSPSLGAAAATALPNRLPLPDAAPEGDNQPQEYRNELAQMREIGITNEPLALQALRVSDGDVTTAADLIFSGWNGEGAEEEHPQEE